MPLIAEPRMDVSRTNTELKLLVEWSSPWREFVTAIRPALARSPKALEAEVASGLFPYRDMLVSMFMEFALLVALIVLPAKFAGVKPLQPKAQPTYDVIYFSGDELPRTEDAGGAKAGRSGRSGGREGHHATQVIRVARGPSLKEQIVDAPKLNLPQSDSAVANLFAYKSVPGSPPAQGMEAATRHAEMPATAVPPAANIQGDVAQTAPVLQADVIAPSPSGLQRELTSRHTLGSRVEVAPPTVSAPREVTNLHPLLTLPPALVVPPAPVPTEREMGSVKTRGGIQELQRQVVPPPEQAGVTSDRKIVNSLGNSAVVAPPAQLGNISSQRRQAGSLRDGRVVPPPAQMSGSLLHQPATGLGDSKVVPPPEQAAGTVGDRKAVNGLGNAAVVAPTAEIGNISSPRRRGGSFGNGRVVPPPAQMSGSLHHAQTTGLGDTKVVPPPEQVAGGVGSRKAVNGLGDSTVVAPAAEIGNVSSPRRRGGSFGDGRVVPPPAQMSGSLLHQQATGLGDTKVVPPPEQVAGGVGDRKAVNGFGNSAVVAPTAQLANVSSGHRRGGSFGDSRVVPPPAQISGSMGQYQQASVLGDTKVVPPPAQLSGSLSHQQANGLGDSKVVPPPARLGGSTMRQTSSLSPGTAVVPPAPSSSGGSATGTGRGRRSPADTLADGVAPPIVADAGIVLSSRPGAKLGVPGTATPGSLAMSPAGGAKPGLGGSGGGTSISHGSGPGSSTSGEGSGAKTNGTGPGSDEIAHKGISPFPGLGGAGKGSTTPPTMAGVSVSGGGNDIVLPSFGTDHKAPDDLAHSPDINSKQGPGITVVATSHSGGAFNYYGALKGDKVYTIYIDTALGTAVMQFADPKSAVQSYPEDLTAPLAIRADLPADLHSSRLVIACTLDRSGLLQSARVVEGTSPELSATILAALPRWKFRPAFRGDQPIEVNAILGFDIDTR